MSKEILYTVPQLSKELAVTERAIRFYESKGLIKPSRAGNTRIFNYKDRARLLIILRAKKLGFSLITSFVLIVGGVYLAQSKESS